ATGILLAGAARADIYEWEDASGAHHYTNDKRGVPSEYQATAHVLMVDWGRPAGAEPAAAAAPPAAPAPAAPAPAVVQVASDVQPWSEGYAAGLRAAAQFSGGGGGLQINAPLAVVSTRTSEGGGYPYGYYPPWPWYYPFVTTGFDRGRSRHQTLRMLLQD